MLTSAAALGGYFYITRSEGLSTNATGKNEVKDCGCGACTDEVKIVELYGAEGEQKLEEVKRKILTRNNSEFCKSAGCMARCTLYRLV